MVTPGSTVIWSVTVRSSVTVGRRSGRRPPAPGARCSLQIRASTAA